MNDRHQAALDLARNGDWDGAHAIVQELSDPVACWIHAILHKIEGDAANSRYWYARSDGRRYEDFADVRVELEAAQSLLERR